MRKDKEIDQKRSKGFLVFFDSIFTKGCFAVQRKICLLNLTNTGKTKDEQEQRKVRRILKTFLVKMDRGEQKKEYKMS